MLQVDRSGARRAPPKALVCGCNSHPTYLEHPDLSCCMQAVTKLEFIHFNPSLARGFSLYLRCNQALGVSQSMQEFLQRFLSDKRLLVQTRPASPLSWPRVYTTLFSKQGGDMECPLIYLPVTKRAQHFTAQPRQLVAAG